MVQKQVAALDLRKFAVVFAQRSKHTPGAHEPACPLTILPILERTHTVVTESRLACLDHPMLQRQYDKARLVVVRGQGALA